jgi:hypothetical protein
LAVQSSIGIAISGVTERRLVFVSEGDGQGRRRRAEMLPCVPLLMDVTQGIGSDPTIVISTEKWATNRLERLRPTTWARNDDQEPGGGDS